MSEPETNSTAIAGSSPVPCSRSSETPDTDACYVRAGMMLAAQVDELDATCRKLEGQRNSAAHLVAIIRVNAMRGTWKEATPEQVDEFLVPWIAKLRVVQGHLPENTHVEEPEGLPPGDCSEFNQ